MTPFQGVFGDFIMEGFWRFYHDFLDLSRWASGRTFSDFKTLQTTSVPPGFGKFWVELLELSKFFV